MDESQGRTQEFSEKKDNCHGESLTRDFSFKSPNLKKKIIRDHTNHPCNITFIKNSLFDVFKYV